MIYPDTKLEEKLWGEGYRVVVGIDEAGRGPFAGPVSAGAVAINSSSEIVDIVRDSKKMTRKRREEAFDLIKESVWGWGIGLVSAKEIDRVGIQEAVLMAMGIALRGVEDMVGSKASYLIVDGLNVELINEYPMLKIKEGDLNHYSIACGSVLAKVERDRVMGKYHLKYPEYGFDSHVGYGTKKHIEAMERYGICDIHRRSYKPVAKYVEEGI
ncbi:ribonuclease HII [bacterium]|nr:ribonuclease HII [bacterium]